MPVADIANRLSPATDRGPHREPALLGRAAAGCHRSAATAVPDDGHDGQGHGQAVAPERLGREPVQLAAEGRVHAVAQQHDAAGDDGQPEQPAVAQRVTSAQPRYMRATMRHHRTVPRTTPRRSTPPTMSTRRGDRGDGGQDRGQGEIRRPSGPGSRVAQGQQHGPRDEQVDRGHDRGQDVRDVVGIQDHLGKQVSTLPGRPAARRRWPGVARWAAMAAMARAANASSPTTRMARVVVWTRSSDGSIVARDCPAILAPEGAVRLSLLRPTQLGRTGARTRRSRGPRRTPPGRARAAAAPSAARPGSSATMRGQRRGQRIRIVAGVVAPGLARTSRCSGTSLAMIARAPAHGLDEGRVRAADLGRLDVRQRVRLQLGVAVAEDVARQETPGVAAAAASRRRLVRRSRRARRRRPRAARRGPPARPRRGSPR